MFITRVGYFQMPVYLSKELANQLYIFQYPVKPPSCTFEKARVMNSRIKPNHQEVRIEFALDTSSENYDYSKGEQIAINTDGATASLKCFYLSFLICARTLKMLCSTAPVPPYRAACMLTVGELNQNNTILVYVENRVRLW